MSFLALWKYCFALPDCRLIAVATVPGTSRSATNRSQSSVSMCPTPRNSAGIASISHKLWENTLIFRLPNWSTSCNVFVGAVMIITGSLFTGWIATKSSFLESYSCIEYQRPLLIQCDFGLDGDGRFLTKLIEQSFTWMNYKKQNGMIRCRLRRSDEASWRRWLHTTEARKCVWETFEYRYLWWNLSMFTPYPHTVEKSR